MLAEVPNDADDAKQRRSLWATETRCNEPLRQVGCSAKQRREEQGETLWEWQRSDGLWRGGVRKVHNWEHFRLHLAFFRQADAVAFLRHWLVLAEKKRIEAPAKRQRCFPDCDSLAVFEKRRTVHAIYEQCADGKGRDDVLGAACSCGKLCKQSDTAAIVASVVHPLDVTACGRSVHCKRRIAAFPDPLRHRQHGPATGSEHLC